MSSRLPHAGQRLPTASALQADQDRLAIWYTKITSIALCARQSGISRKTVRAILDRHGIPRGSPGPQTQGPPQALCDEEARVPRR